MIVNDEGKVLDGVNLVTNMQVKAMINNAVALSRADISRLNTEVAELKSGLARLQGYLDGKGV